MPSLRNFTGFCISPLPRNSPCRHVSTHSHPPRKQDRAYLEKRSRELTSEGFSCDAVLALGEPSDEIIKLAREKDVDLIAMTTHGHRFVSDILYGATADKVRHEVDVPVLL